VSVEASATSSSVSSAHGDELSLFWRMLPAAPVAAVAIGIAAEWLDFRALRYPILLFVLAAVLLTSGAMDRLAPHESARLAALRTIVVGVLTWGAAEALYVVIHAMRGEPFDADRFGPQPAQALGLIAVHAFVLGAPTGIVAAMLLRVRAWWTARR
jgi:hypothetical protein